MDIDQFRLSPNQNGKHRSRTKRPFLKGPIPLKWLQCAAGLPGKALQVGLALWYLAGVKRSKVIKFSYKRAEEFGTKRHAAYRGLRALEKAGLIGVEKGQGRAPMIFIEEQPLPMEDA